MERSENKTKKAKAAIIFASKQNEAKRKRNFFHFDAKKVFFACFHI
jgi:UDP-3-O-[3-hydroxymyristoyl] glucosamine N-acyltransferase